jgi:tripartite-type tricarboxylate transporter receptor subunit TctC
MVYMRAGLGRGRRSHGQILFLASMLLTAVPAAVTHASAQDYPTRTVKVIVPHPAGGTADAMPRIVADWLSRKWKQPVIIENRVGAAGNIGAEVAFRSDPDGYTLMAAAPSPLVINHNLYPKMNFDPTKFVPIAVMGQVPNALVVNPQFSAKSVAAVIAYAKANPGKLTSATQGNGSTSHLTSEMLQIMAGIKVQHVPYRGSAPALTDLMGGSVQIMFDNLGVSLPLVQSGKIRLLGVATAKRLAALPNVPTISETLPGFESAGWFAYVAPPMTPPAIVAKVNADINEALRQHEIVERMHKLSAEIVGGSPAETAEYLRKEIERWQNVIKTGKIKL